MNTYSTPRNNILAALLVVGLATLVSNGLALDQRLIYERQVLAASASGALVATAPSYSVRIHRVAP